MSAPLSNVVQFTEQYPIQSYFDAAPELTTPPSQALLEQPQNEAIVPSTFKSKSGQSGYALGLAPWSQAPVAVVFDFGQAGQSAAQILRPGQVFTPNGGQPFKGFDYGLPFGWLGGGTVTLFLFKTPNARVDWYGQNSPVLFHRLRTTILEAPLAQPNYVNWPNKFPWAKAFRYIAGPPVVEEAQAGQPVITVSPSLTVLKLNQGASVITYPNNQCSMIFWGTDAFGIGADGITASAADNVFVDLSWPDNSLIAVGDRNPVIQLVQETDALSSNQWGISIVAPVGSPLVGLTVDIARYGRI